MLNPDHFIHIPIEEAIQIKDGATVMLNRYWTEYVPGHISVYIGSTERMYFGRYRTYMPQSNRHEQIATRKGTMKANFIPVVYFEDKQYE